MSALFGCSESLVRYTACGDSSTVIRKTEEKTVFNTALWALLICAGVCAMGSILGSPPIGRMWRVDVLELRRRRHMIEVLERNARSLRREPDTATVGDYPSRAPGYRG